MTLLIISFIAGVLTVLAPCILPLLPVIIGGSVTQDQSKARKLKPYIVTGSLAASVVVFTLIIKVGTFALNIPQEFWTYVSGAIVLIFALSMLLPKFWAKISHKIGVEKSSNRWLATASKKQNLLGDVFLGAALGPVFSSCSPTYFVIIGIVLPESFAKGMVYLIAYALGLAVILLLIAKLGQNFATKLAVLSDPNGWFKKVIGVLFLLVAVMLFTGWDKKIETWLLDNNLVPAIGLEQKLVDKFTDL